VPVLGRQVQRRLSVLIRRFDIRPFLQEQPHRRLLPNFSSLFVFLSLLWLLLGKIAQSSAVFPSLSAAPKGRGRSENEYQRKLKSLKNRISNGRKWYLMQQKFSSGIFALVHTDGDNKIHNFE
jgi:hypothetical protein